MTISADEISVIMKDVIDNFLIPKFNELGMNTSGEWLDNLGTTSEENRGTITGRDYTVQLQNGRMPGSMPPIEPIEKWVNLKFGLYGTEARSAAFAIARNMQQKGTSWYQKGGSGLLDVLSSDECINYINSQISNFMQVKVANEIRRITNEILIT